MRSPQQEPFLQSSNLGPDACCWVMSSHQLGLQHPKMILLLEAFSGFPIHNVVGSFWSIRLKEVAVDKDNDVAQL